MQVSFLQGQLHIQLDKRFEAKSAQVFLEEQLRLPTAFIRKLFAQGRIRTGGKVVKPQDTFPAGTKIILTDPTEIKETRLISEAPTALDVLFEDDHVLVVHKPAGMIVHDETTDVVTLDDCVAQYYEATGQILPVLHVHRLDRPTTGVVIYAKHGFVARALDLQLQEHEIQRVYYAFVYGKQQPKNQTVEWRIGRDRHRQGAYRVSSSGKSARTHFHVRHASLYDGQYLTFLECHLSTGRTHQIRVHAMASGAPILADALYHGVDVMPFSHVEDHIALHAARVTFYHPYDEEQITVQSPVNQVWRDFLRQHCWVEGEL